MGGWGWGLMMFLAAEGWTLILVVGFVLRHLVTTRLDRRSAPRPTPEDEPAGRSARGEIDEDEYRRRRTLVADRVRAGG